MTTLADYQVQSKLYQSRHTVVFAGVRLTDGMRVVIKSASGGTAVPARNRRLRREFHMAGELDSPYTPRYLELISSQMGLALVMEDTGGRALQHELQPGGMALQRFLPLALEMARALADIHQRGVVHKDIKPANFLVMADRPTVRLIDFGISSRLTQAYQERLNPGRLEGTLPYISPEQTGRMNRPLDYRTDFYSLGATFYHMLAGRPPFVCEDALEAIHSHLARAHVPLKLVRADLPEVLSDLVEKLLAKAAEERYQSAEGLVKDLNRCWGQWQLVGKIGPFEPAREDVSERFSLPGKLYGRASELKQMQAVFGRVLQGRRELLLVSGEPGVGKTRLVCEMEATLLEHRGFFAVGRFERLAREKAYSAVGEAFGRLIHMLLGEADHVIEHWRTMLREALGENASAVAGVVPHLNLILGETTDGAGWMQEEGRRRFHNAVGRLVSCFASAERPFLLFLDNVHLADLASMELLEALLTNPSVTGLLVVCAARDDAADAWLKRTISGTSAGLRVHRLHLSCLTEDDLTDLLADTLHRPRDEARRPAEVLMRKSRGNPYHALELLESFYNRGLIRFDAAHHAWLWDDQGIRAWAMPDSLADLVIGRLDTLPPAARRLLCLGACEGETFGVDVLAHVAHMGEERVLAALAPAIEQHLVIPLQRDHLPGAEDVGEDMCLRFQHHRVHRAAYGLMDPLERAHVHLEIGRLLRDEGREVQPAVVIHHLNASRALLENDAERTALAGLNLTAAGHALAAMAYAAAAEYVAVGLECLPADAWQSAYRLSFDLHMRRAEAAYLSGDYAAARGFWAEAGAYAAETLDRAAVLEMEMVDHMTRGAFSEAVDTGLRGLALLGLPAVRRPSPWGIGVRALWLRRRLRRARLGEVLNMPPAHDAVLRARLGLLMRLNLAAYLTGERHLYAACALRRVSLSLQGGNGPGTAIAFVTYGLLLAVYGRHPRALLMGSTALALDDRFPDRNGRCKLLFIYAFCIHGWHHHWRTMGPYLQEAVEVGLQTGDQLYGTLACMMITWWDQCHNVRTALDDGTYYMDMLNASGFRGHTGIAEVFLRFRRCLMGETDGPTSLAGGDFDEAGCLAKIRASEFRSGMALYHLLRLQLAVLYDDMPGAVEHVTALSAHHEAVVGTPLEVMSAFFCFLASVRAARRRVPRAARRAWSQMRTWARLCPDNFAHMADLMEAELCRLRGRSWQAATLYRAAVDGARRNRFTMFQAIGAECAFRFFRDAGHATPATAYLREADAAYHQWGATAKVAHLRESCPNQLLDRARRVSRRSDTTGVTVGDAAEFGADSGRDLKHVIHIAGELSREMDHARLVGKILEAALSTTKATRAALIDRRRQRFMVLGVLAVNGTLEDTPALLDHSDRVCRQAVNRTTADAQTLLLSRAHMTHPYNRDPYVLEHAVGSILCVPLRTKDQIQGALYLETEREAPPLTDADAAWLTMVAGPAAVSLENAQLFSQTRAAADEVKKLNRELARLNEDLELRVRERTAELEQVQRKLVEKAHHEGMNEIATSVLHNVGSILNSVLTSCQTLQTTIDGSRMPGLLKANDMLRDNMHRVVDFLCDEPKGRDLLRYYLALSDPLVKEQATVEENIARLIEKVEHIRTVILAQQSYARAGFQRVDLPLAEAVEDALSILSSVLARATVTVVRRFRCDAPLHLPKNKVIHVSVCLIRNAVQAMEDLPPERRTLEISLEASPEGQVLAFRDMGRGIAPEHLERIFEHGFTTRAGAQGFGLHAAANAMTEMGGSVAVHSDGPDLGAVFKLFFPQDPPRDHARDEPS